MILKLTEERGAVELVEEAFLLPVCFLLVLLCLFLSLLLWEASSKEAKIRQMGTQPTDRQAEARSPAGPPLFWEEVTSSREETGSFFHRASYVEKASVGLPFPFLGKKAFSLRESSSLSFRRTNPAKLRWILRMIRTSVERLAGKKEETGKEIR